MEDRAELKLFRDVMPASSRVVYRLIASVEVPKQRVKIGESDISQQEYVAPIAKLNVILDRGQLEDFTVINENRSLAEIALEMLTRAGWSSN